MKKISFILIVSLLLGIFALPASAEEHKFHYLDSERDVVIYVSWPTEEPNLTFRAPNGTIYDPNAKNENTVTTVGEKELYYIIYNAPAGQWYVELDKRGNDKVDIGMFDYQDAPVIESFSLGKEENGRVPVTFTVTQNENRSYEYKIYAAAEKGGAEKELDSGVARTNSEVKTKVDLRSLSSYSGYMLKLYVWYTENGTDFFDQVYSEPFSYINSDKTSSMKNFEFSVDPDASLVSVSWPEIDNRAEKVMVALFEGDSAEPAMYDSYDPDKGSVQLSYDPAASKIRVEISVMINGVFTETLKKTAEIARCPIALEDTTATNIPRLRLDYKEIHSAKVFVTVGATSEELLLNGTGDVTVKLEEGWNDVEVRYTDTEGVTWFLSRRVFVDRNGPILRMNDNYDGMITSRDSIEIGGIVTDGHLLTINGTQIELSVDGTFSYTMSLSGGEYELVVTASDKLKNETRYSATITSTTGGYRSNGPLVGEDGRKKSVLESIFSPDGYLWMILSGVLCLMVIAYVLIFWRRDKKAGGKKS